MKTLPLVVLALMLHFPGPAAALEQDKPAPPADIRLLDGSRFSLADQKGKVVIINFWATWCSPCVAEMDALQRYYDKHKKNGLEIVAVSVDLQSDEPRVRRTMKSFTFPGGMAYDANLDGYGSVGRVPRTFVIDHRGVLRKDGSRGSPGIDYPTLEWLVTPYLPGPGK